MAPGVIFSDADNVVPDVVWISNERLTALMDEAGHLTGAPELAVEVLSPGVENERRDREAKLKLYESRGVREYWIVDWRIQQLEVYRRDQAMLRLAATLFAEDVLTSPLLPGFSCPVERLFT
jgi:Uma2 family endonuclease